MDNQALNREQRRRLKRKFPKVYKHDKKDHAKLDKLVDMGAIKKWVRTDEGDSYNVLLNNGTVLNVPDQYFAEWFMNVIDEYRGQLIALSGGDTERRDQINALVNELKIYSGEAKAPAGYNPSPQRAAEAASELRELLKKVSQA